jgi:hypothetical protein
MATTQKKRPTIKDIVAYPIMNEGDCKQIMEFRRIGVENPSPIEKIIYPYFRFHEQLSVDEDINIFLKRLDAELKNFGAFNFTIRDGLVFEHDIAGCFVGLVAMEGQSEFLHLSSMIYATIESINIKRNVFQSIYLPYIHIAYQRYYKDAKVILDNLKQQDLEIKGRIEKLSIREYEGNNLNVIHKIHFKS